MDDFKIDALATRELRLSELDNAVGGAVFAGSDPAHLMGRLPCCPPPPPLPIQWADLPKAPPVLY
jgi:hypothetical protein